MAADPSIIGTLSNALMALREQYNKATVVPPVTLEYADTTDENDVTPSNNASLADLYKGKLEELNALSIFQTGSNVSEQAIIPLLNDKKIISGKLERDEASGKFKPWYFVNDKGEVEVSDQPVDLALINSPDFLNNEELSSKVVNATFKVQETEPYSVDGKLVEITDANVKINIYHNDVFIGRLPAFKEGMASHLLALRQAVVAQETVAPITAQSTDTKADIEGRRQDSLHIVTEDDLKKGEDVGLTEENSVWKGDYYDNQNVLRESFTGTKEEVIAKINAKYDAELAALEQPSATNAKADIENKIKAFNKSIENEFEEGDYNKVLTLAEKQVKDGTIPQTPANIQLLTNYPKLFEELIKATDARNKTIAEFDKEKVLAGIPNKLPIYGIKSTINPATGRLDIKWIEVNKEVITNIQLTKIGNYAAEAFFNYKSELQKELAALGQPTTQQQTVEQEVERLRAEEQEEIKAKFPDAEYKADGKIDVSKLSAKDKKVYKDIYKRYDALITPRLEQAKKDAKEIIDKNFEDIAIQLANSKDERFFNENNEFKKCK
jgi:hypothetical protein